MEKLTKYIDKFFLGIAIVLSLPAVWALLVPGFYGASDELHIAWLYEMFKTLGLGQMPVRFVPDLSFGFGYPLFNFVFPLPFYLGSLFHLLGFTLVDSIKLVFFASVPLSGYFMYKLLREYVDPALSVLGVLIYIYTPYRATDIYLRGAIGEIFSFVFLPLIILSFVKVITGRVNINYKWIGISAISIAGLILSHNITSYMFLPFALAFCALRISKTGLFKKNIFSTLASFILGLVISSFFWVPALTESELVKYSTTFDYWDHFPTLRQLITPYFGYGASVPGNYDMMSFFIGYANIAMILVSLAVFLLFFRKIKNNDREVFVWSFITVLVSVFLMNYRSGFVWKNFPFLPYFQFPWRFLTLISFATAFMVVSLKFVNSKIVGLLLIFLVFLSFPNFKPQDFLGREDGYYLAKYIPHPEVKKDYLTHSEEYLRLPVGATRRPNRLYPRFFSEDLVEVVVFEKNSLEAGANVEAPDDTILSYNKYYFPGWVVKVDGHEVEAHPGMPFGQVSFRVPKGKHKVEVGFEETSFRKVVNLVSFIGLVTALGFCIKKANEKHTK